MPSLIPTIPDELHDAIEARKCIPFIGAGMSMPAGMPGFRSLMEKLADDLGLPESQKNAFLDQNDFPGLAGAIAAHARRSDRQFAQLVLRAVQPFNRQPTENHRLLAALKAPLYITTNWDDLIEQAIYQEGEDGDNFPTVIADSRMVPIFDTDGPTVIKLHGDMHHPENLVVTRKQYDTYYNTTNIIAQLFAPRVANHTFLFLGYGLQDSNILSILDIVHEKTQYDTDHYAVMFGQPDAATLASLQARRVKVLSIHA